MSSVLHSTVKSCPVSEVAASVIRHDGGPNMQMTFCISASQIVYASSVFRGAEMTKREISSHMTIKCLNPVVEVGIVLVKTNAVEWFVRVGNASVKGSESVGFAFELLAAAGRLSHSC